MNTYNYKELLSYFSKQLNQEIPEYDSQIPASFEVQLDQYAVELIPSAKGLEIKLCLGMLLHPVRLEKLQDMIHSNFLGINTGGCTLCIDDEGVGIYLKNTTTISTTPQENWEWMHRILCVGKEWIKLLSKWEEFVPMVSEFQEK